MAQATTIKGGKVFFRLALPDTDPVVYTTWCGMTSRTFTWTRNLEETNIPDCEDPDAVSYVGRGATSLSMSISGEGVVAKESFKNYTKLLNATDSALAEIELVFSETEKFLWRGKVQISSFEIGAPNGQTVTLNISFDSDGEMKLIEDETSGGSGGSGSGG